MPAVSQPMKDGKKDGAVIEGYYPAVVTEEEWLAARAGRQQRRLKPGRVGKRINIFAGLLYSATDRGPYHLSSWKVSGETRLVLVNFRATEGLERFASFPYEPLEAGILSRLRELNPKDVLDGGDKSSPDELVVLSGRLAVVDSELTDLTADMEANGFSQTLAGRVRSLESRHSQLVTAVTDARQRAAHPASESWGEMKTLVDLLDSAKRPTDVRIRLQSALRKMVLLLDGRDQRTVKCGHRHAVLWGGRADA